MKKQSFSLAAMSLAVAVSVQVHAEERTLNVYHWSDYVAPDTISNFEKQTGIKVVFDVYDNNEVLKPSCCPVTPVMTSWCPPTRFWPSRSRLACIRSWTVASCRSGTT